MRAPVRQLSMAGEVGEEVCAQLDLGRGLRQRLARVTRSDLADGVRVLADQVGEAPQDTSPLAGRGLRPRAGLIGPAGRPGGAIDVFGFAERDLRDLAARRGIDGGKRLARGGFDLRTVDEMADSLDPFRDLHLGTSVHGLTTNDCRQCTSPRGRRPEAAPSCRAGPRVCSVAR